MDAKSLGNHMRKSALFVAVALAAALSTSPTFAAKKADPAVAAQNNTNNLMRDAMNPGMAKSAKPAKKHKKMAKRHKKSMKKKM